MGIDMGVPETDFEMEKVVTPDKKIVMINRNKKFYAKIRKKGFPAKLLYE